MKKILPAMSTKLFPKTRPNSYFTLQYSISTLLNFVVLALIKRIRNYAQRLILTRILLSGRACSIKFVYSVFD